MQRHLLAFYYVAKQRDNTPLRLTRVVCLLHNVHSTTVKRQWLLVPEKWLQIPSQNILAKTWNRLANGQMTLISEAVISFHRKGRV